MITTHPVSTELAAIPCDGGWVVTGSDCEHLVLVNDYLRHLGDRHYAPGTRRSYAFDLLAFCRWLGEEQLAISAGPP